MKKVTDDEWKEIIHYLNENKGEFDSEFDKIDNWISTMSLEDLLKFTTERLNSVLKRERTKSSAQSL